MERIESLVERFPESFRFGVATSAYQIEGATRADGRGASIWDTFATQPGAIERGESADVACDHYHRRDADVALLAHLGVDSYRFSIAWPRVQPLGSGAVNASGLAFYDQLIDRLLAEGIAPFPTLYHWDLPQALQDLGGWTARETADRFADYAALVVDRLGDRVSEWALFNEPYIFVSRGYLLGRYAPGHSSIPEFLRAVHTVTRAHALGYRAIKACRANVDVGSVFALAPCEPATDSARDQQACQFADAAFNHLFLDPLFTGAYPQRVLDTLPIEEMAIEPGDLDAIRTPLDFIGINCYYRLVISAGESMPDLPFIDFGLRNDVRNGGSHADLTDTAYRVHSSFGRNEGARTDMGWEVWPSALQSMLLRLHAQYPGVPLHVCESGCALLDRVDEHGHVSDPERTAYHRVHLMAVAAAIADGADVRSYHAWSLYDNFEWASGYRPRFGLVRVDFETQRRTVKASGEWFRQLCLAARTRREPLVQASPQPSTAQ